MICRICSSGIPRSRIRGTIFSIRWPYPYPPKLKVRDLQKDILRQHELGKVPVLDQQAQRSPAAARRASCRSRQASSATSPSRIGHTPASTPAWRNSSSVSESSTVLSRCPMMTRPTSAPAPSRTSSISNGAHGFRPGCMRMPAPGLLLRSGSRPQHLPLVVVQRPRAAKLADDPRLNACGTDADRQFLDDLLGDLVLGTLVHVIGMNDPDVVPRAHDDVHPGRPGDPSGQPQRVPADPYRRGVDDSAAAPLARTARSRRLPCPRRAVRGCRCS